jgi:hypothetical protein
MTSAFVCASLGIVPTVRHADYIGSWLEVLREDDRAIVRAASAASKAADYLLAFRPDPSEPVDAIQAADELEMALCAFVAGLRCRPTRARPARRPPWRGHNCAGEAVTAPVQLRQLATPETCGAEVRHAGRPGTAAIRLHLGRRGRGKRAIP